MAETLETLDSWRASTNRIECTLSGRKTLCEVSGKPCTVVLAGVGDAGEDMLRIPCFSCTGFPKRGNYWNFYAQQVTALIRQNFSFVRVRCAERVGASFVTHYLDDGVPQICPLLSNSNDAVPYVVVRVDMEVRRLKNPWREGYCGPLPPDLFSGWESEEESGMESEEEVKEESAEEEVKEESGMESEEEVKEEVKEDSEEEEEDFPKMERPCDHVYPHPQTISLDWYVNGVSCPICTYHHHQ